MPLGAGMFKENYFAHSSVITISFVMPPKPPGRRKRSSQLEKNTLPHPTLKHGKGRKETVPLAVFPTFNYSAEKVKKKVECRQVKWAIFLIASKQYVCASTVCGPKTT